ncbi:MAG: HAD family hydrolase [Nanoarchaeota archaeon]|nr:HAD family hydrolase [Nanoarchaeota archaeon]
MKYKGVFWDIDDTLYDASAPWDVDVGTERELMLGKRKLEVLTEDQLSCFKPYKGLSELMQDIPREKQGIISNGGHQLQIDKLKLLEVYEYLNPELIFTSYGEIEKILKDSEHPLFKEAIKYLDNKEELFFNLRGYTGKPNSYMFERALEKIKVGEKCSSVEDYVMIGDDWKDIEGAQKVGMDNILISRDEKHLHNPWTNKIITPNQIVERGNIDELRKLLFN